MNGSGISNDRRYVASQGATGNQAIRSKVASRSSPPSGKHSQLTHFIALAIAAGIILWTLLVFWIDSVRFALLTPDAQTGVEGASTFARFFGALVLLLFPQDRMGARLRWVAGGLIVMAVGSLIFGYLWPLFSDPLDLNTAMYASLLVWTTANVLFFVGLMPFLSPQLSRHVAILTASVMLLAAVIMLAQIERLPPLVETMDLALNELHVDAPLRGLTAWHWVLSSIPFTLAIAAVAGAVYFFRRGALGGWLLIAMILLAGSKLHNLFWPSAYSPVLTTASVLRLLFAAVIVGGGVVELRRIAAERAELLATEREYSRGLAQLAELKDDFTAMVAHELGSPIGAIRLYSTMLTLDDLPAARKQEALTAIQRETDLLTTLVADVQDISAAERSDFTVRLTPVRLDTLVSDAAAFAASLDGDHPLHVDPNTGYLVLADSERIGQVLRNLLSNAAKYSPVGTTIHIQTKPTNGNIRIEVVDEGIGIHADDQGRIFERFGRAHRHRMPEIRGSGLGLYLSQQIVRAHGSHITVRSKPGEGSAFGFELEIVK